MSPARAHGKSKAVSPGSDSRRAKTEAGQIEDEVRGLVELVNSAYDVEDCELALALLSDGAGGQFEAGCTQTRASKPVHLWRVK